MQGRLSPMIKKKIQCFPEKCWKEEFPIANKLGIKFIEWTLDYKNLYKNPLLTKSGIDIILKLSKKNSIKIKSLTGDCFMQKPFWKNNEKKLINDLKKIISSCSKIGIKYIIVPLVDNGKIENNIQKKKLINICCNITNFLKKKKVKILFESDFEPLILKNFIKNFSRSAFGINYDLGNSASLGYNIDEEFECYSSYINNIHIKDRILKGSTVRLGKGNADFIKFFKNLKKYKYKNMLIYQTARSKKKKDIEEMKINISFIKKHMKKVYG